MSPRSSSSSNPAPQHPVVLFDGVCNLCHAAVRFILARDRRKRVRFASLQSDAARRLLAERGWVRELPDSVFLVEGDRVYALSAAVLRIVRLLDAPWPLCYALIAVPRPVRDSLYRAVARRRYRWFGRKETCPRPEPELASRFLDAAPSKGE